MYYINKLNEKCYLFITFLYIKSDSSSDQKPQKQLHYFQGGVIQNETAHGRAVISVRAQCVPAG